MAGSIREDGTNNIVGPRHRPAAELSRQMDNRPFVHDGRSEPGNAGHAGQFGWENRLAQAIVSMVIPRLKTAHDENPEGESGVAAETLRLRIAAERFIALVLSGSQDAQWRALKAMQDSGTDLETIFLEVMAPAIRHLGALWEDDRMSFLDVTTKSAHLQHMMRRLGAEERITAVPSNRRLLLAPAPGEQHTFGLFLLAEMFLRIGWDAVMEPMLSLAELCERLSAEPFDAVGLSVGSERSLSSLSRSIASARAAVSSPDFKVFLGGWAFLSHDKPLDGYGADLIETDARAAVAKAQILCPIRESESEHR